MSTNYRANGKTLADAIAAGWVYADDTDIGETSRVVVLVGPGGYVHAIESTDNEGEQVLWFEKFGGNDASQLVNALGAISEHEEGFLDGFLDDEDEPLTPAE